MARGGTGHGEPSWGREAGGPSSVSTCPNTLPRLRRSCACPGDSSPRPVRFPRGLPLAGWLGAAWGLWWAWPARGRGSHSRDALLPPPGVRVKGLGTLGSRAGEGRGARPGGGAWGAGRLAGWRAVASAPLPGLVFPRPLRAPALTRSPFAFVVLPGGARGSWAGLRAAWWPAQALGRGVGIRPLPEPVTGCRLPVVGPGRSWQEAAVPSPPCLLVTGPCCDRELGSALWPCRSPKFKSASLCLLPSPEAWRWGPRGCSTRPGPLV